MVSLTRSTVATLCLALAAALPLAAQLPARPAHRPAAAPAGERMIQAEQVPAAVRDAFARAYPYATVVRYTAEDRADGALYRVSSRAGSVHRVVVLDASGTILRTETRISAAQLPAAVRTAAEAGGTEVESATLVVAGADTTYAVAIRGRKGELTFTADGRPVGPSR